MTRPKDGEKDVLSAEEIETASRKDRGIPQAREMARILASHEALRADVAWFESEAQLHMGMVREANKEAIALRSELARLKEESERQSRQKAELIALLDVKEAELSQRRLLVDRISEEMTALRASRERMREALEEIARDTACRCDSAYTKRGLCEPNALCYLEDVARAALSGGEKP